MRRILGIDVGARRIGVAISDPLGLTAQPLTVVEAGRSAIAEIIRLAADHDVEEIVVGLPVSLSGHEGKAAALARDFGNDLASRSGLPVVYADERFTTTVAERVLVEGGVRRSRRRDIRDKMAAAIMLQSHLDARPWTS